MEETTMTRINSAGNGKQIWTFDLQNSENVKCSPETTNEPSAQQPEETKAKASSPAHPMEKLNEADLQAKARAAELNSQLNTRPANPPHASAFYDLLISSFKDSVQPKTQQELTSYQKATETESN
jgi:hypothetical protein